MKTLYTLVGMKHRGTEKIVADLPAGYPLLLIREPDNKFDPNAVQVWANDRHVAYVKATEVRPLCQILDDETWHQCSRNTGRPCINGVFAVTADRWPMVEIAT